MIASDKKYYVYVLYSIQYNQLYIGHSDNLDRRFKQHNSGRVPSTKPYIPYKTIYTEEFSTKSEAVLRETELKSSTGRRFLRKLLLT